MELFKENLEKVLADVREEVRRVESGGDELDLTEMQEMLLEAYRISTRQESDVFYGAMQECRSAGEVLRYLDGLGDHDILLDSLLDQTELAIFNHFSLMRNLDRNSIKLVIGAMRGLDRLRREGL